MNGKIGRPTDYKPAIIEEIDKYLEEAVPENMKIPTVEGIALKLGISRDTLYEWAKVHPEFSDTLEKLKMKQKEALIQTGIFGGKEVNSTIISLLLKVNHDMIETERKELVGQNGQPIFGFLKDFVSAGGWNVPASDRGTKGPDEVQGTGVAQEGKKDVNSSGEDKSGSA